MQDQIIVQLLSKVTSELALNMKQVEAVLLLLEEGATIPFIARYRKEKTGSLDEIQITQIRDRYTQLKELESRRETILKSLSDHGHLTDELQQKVDVCDTMAELEDVYLPFRPKRRTKATIAKEKGLEPLAQTVLAQQTDDVEEEALKFVDPEKEVLTAEDALKGARDIIAEIINEDQEVRATLRTLFNEKGMVTSKVSTGKEDAAAKYKDYFEWSEPVTTIPSHRLLAIRRGENEEFLNLSITPSQDDAIELIERQFITSTGTAAEQVKTAILDSYKRLLSRSMETEVRIATKENADKVAIGIFTENLRQLLLSAPLGEKRIMGLDPGFRTGCKMVCLDAQGKLLHFETIYPHTGETKAEAAKKIITTCCEKFEIEAIAVGNGTAGRETTSFLNALGLNQNIKIVMVNESGASIYSASAAAREEFPDLDLTVRGAVSIGRRLMDPLAELVKIDPKSIGVGQYQHDVDQTALKVALDDTVISCVNHVGVAVNTASVQLLTYVSGLGPQLAKNIVTYRNENGAFQSRAQLKKVPRLGPKAFEQSAGFLRIRDGKNPLDESAVHPEAYPVIDKMAKNLDCTVKDLMTNQELRNQIKLTDYKTESIGIPTLNDIMKELAKPGRDPREQFDDVKFNEDINKISDLIVGMALPGTVTNVTAFGAFIDIGVHQDGLVHISEMADRFIKDPAEIVKVNQKVNVRVLSVDIDRKRIGLSMKKPSQSNSMPKKNKVKTKAASKPQKNRPAPFNNPFESAFNNLRKK